MSDEQHGGARAGAGRKPKAEKYETEIGLAERRIADRLPKVIENLEELADGGYQRVKRVLKPAALIFVGTGEWATLAFPEIAQHDPTRMICIEEQVEIADKDRAANIYLADRVMGKPTQRTEITGEDGGPIEVEALTPEERAVRLAAILSAAEARKQAASGGE